MGLLSQSRPVCVCVWCMKFKLTWLIQVNGLKYKIEELTKKEMEN